MNIFQSQKYCIFRSRSGSQPKVKFARQQGFQQALEIIYLGHNQLLKMYQQAIGHSPLPKDYQQDFLLIRNCSVL